jgi:signal transduction histidine kinase
LKSKSTKNMPAHEPSPTLDASLESIEESLDSVVRRLCGILSNDLDPASIQTIALPNARLRPCHEVKQCSRVDCPAYGRTDNLRCWEINRTFCPQGIDPKDALEKIRFCDECVVYRQARTDAKERIVENVNRLLFLTRLKYTEAQDLRALLQQSERVASTSEIALGVLHEIKNPLSIILGRLDCLGLELKDLSLADIGEDLNVIRNHALRMQRLSEGPLGLAHPAAGEIGLFSMNDIILETLAGTRKTLDRTGIEIKVDLDPRIPRILGSRPQIQQVLLNLVLNARDAMPNGGMLSVISLNQEGSAGGVIVEIRDTGGGIAVEHQERIFTPFFSTKAKHEGMGLGLAISRRILQQHHGRITVQSELNMGATFRIWLPGEGSDK